MSKGKMTLPSDPSSRVDIHESTELATANSSYAFRPKGSSGPTQVYPRPGGTETESKISLRGPSSGENELTGKLCIGDGFKMSSREQVENNAQLEKQDHRQGIAGEENLNFGTQPYIGQPAKDQIVVTKTASESTTLTPTSLRDSSEQENELNALKDYPSSESESISLRLLNFDKKDEIGTPEAGDMKEAAELDANADFPEEKLMDLANEEIEQKDATGLAGEPKAQEAQGTHSKFRNANGTKNILGSDDQFLNKCVPPEDENGELNHLNEFRGRQQEEVMANYKYNCIEPQGWPDDERAVLGGNAQDKHETGEDFTRQMLLAYLKDSMTKWLDKVKRIKRSYPGEKMPSKRPKLRKRAASYNYIWNTEEESDNRGIPMKMIIEQWRNRFAKGLNEEIGEIKSSRREPRGRSRSCGSICMGRTEATDIEDRKAVQKNRNKTPPQAQSISPSLHNIEKANLVEGGQKVLKMADGSQKAQQPQTTATPKPPVAALVPDLQRSKVPKQPGGTGQTVEVKKHFPANAKPEGIKQVKTKPEPGHVLQKETESKERLLAALAQGLIKLHRKALELEKIKQEQMQLQMQKMQQKCETPKSGSPGKVAEKHQLKDDAVKRLADANQLKPKMKAEKQTSDSAKGRHHRQHSPKTSSGGKGIQPNIHKDNIRANRKEQSPILRAKPTRHHLEKGRRDRSPYHSPIASPRVSHHRHGRHGHHKLNRKTRKSSGRKPHHHRLSPARKHAKAKKSRSGRKAEKHHRKDRKTTPERSGKQLSNKHREKRKRDKARLQEHKVHPEKPAGRHHLRREQEPSQQRPKGKHTTPKDHEEQRSPKWKARAGSKEEAKVQAKKGSNKSDSDHRLRSPEKPGKIQSPTLTRKDATKPLKEQALQQPQTPKNLLRSPRKLSKEKNQREKKDVTKSPMTSKKDNSGGLKTPKAKMENVQAGKRDASRSPVISKMDENSAFDLTKAIMEKKKTTKKNTGKLPVISKSEEGSFKKAGVPKEKNPKEKRNITKNDLAKRK
ncbi:hypothetical protein TTRE_0000152701 [Trichuris trichiura]|uniref:Uncharacterized protein n=1 Tax=Trichuris trichiura TaxID=36087 RepID=A0A077Z0N9_TRITR|nr:hypothetical protein TTRE_0000152701 [Trichuris trichiura]